MLSTCEAWPKSLWKATKTKRDLSISRFLQQSILNFFWWWQFSCCGSQRCCNPVLKKSTISFCLTQIPFCYSLATPVNFLRSMLLDVKDVRIEPTGNSISWNVFHTCGLFLVRLKGRDFCKSILDRAVTVNYSARSYLQQGWTACKELSTKALQACTEDGFYQHFILGTRLMKS